jgi:hypothetical protein
MNMEQVLQRFSEAEEGKANFQLMQWIAPNTEARKLTRMAEP